jgi:hypothetical protein
MTGTTKLVLGIVVGLFLVGIIAVVGLNSQKKTDSSSTNQNSSSSQNTVQEKDVATTIIYTDQGFQPNLYTIDANNYIRVRNNSNRSLQFMSDPVETNSDELELNLGVINPGDNVKVYISQKGTWGYHNALNANDIGQIIVR